MCSVGIRVQSQFEGDLIGENPAVASIGLEVLELPLADGVVVGDQMVDVTGQSRVAQGHGCFIGIAGRGIDRSGLYPGTRDPFLPRRKSGASADRCFGPTAAARCGSTCAYGRESWTSTWRRARSAT